MNRHHPGRNLNLPVELLSAVFDSLTLRELVRSSHVSAYWRSVAVRHRIFWRDITLAAALAAALDFFLTRLGAGLNRTVTVRLYAPPLDFTSDQRSLVLSAVSRNLHRIDWLRVELDVSFDMELFAALDSPAPRLETLDLTVVNDDQPSDALPVDLLALHAPRLRYVRLINIRLLAHRLPHVFSSIRHLHYCFGETLTFPTAVFSHCRALEKLVIYGKHCVLKPAEDETRAHGTRNLRSVEVAVFDGSSDLVRCLPCASIPKVAVALHDCQSVSDLLAHLRGRVDLRLDMEPGDQHLYLHYLAPDTGMQRTFLCAPEQVSECYLPATCVSDKLMSRVQSVQATANCANLLPAFGELAACTRIALSLQDGQQFAPPPHALSVSKLERIELSSGTPRSLDAGELAGFLEAAFVHGDEAVQVALSGVTLLGDLAALSHDRFVVAPASHA